jgi:hypothetical protein
MRHAAHVCDPSVFPGHYFRGCERVAATRTQKVRIPPISFRRRINHQQNNKNVAYLAQVVIHT